MAELKNVEMIRAMAVRASGYTVDRVRIYTSQIDGNHDAVELLRGNGGDMLKARIAELILEHMGHETAVKAGTDGRVGESLSMRAVRKAGRT